MSAPDPGGRPVIIGGGAAGLMTALQLAPEPVLVLTRASLGGEGSTALAQGGIATVIGGDDHVDLHVADTMAAGDGLCCEAMVRRVVEAAPHAIGTLERLGVAFDRDAKGAIRLGLEAAHSRRRIVHAAGDATGYELVRALAAAARRTESITILEDVEARRLIVKDGAVAGVLAASGGAPLVLPSRRVVLATGGLGGLFDDTTNPVDSFGQGLALAARAGARLTDLEFVQFHPTALDTSRRPMALVSEAVRGEGALLVDEHGRRILAATPGEELAPRDVVARSVWRHMLAGHRVYLDARQCLGQRFSERFPGIAEQCLGEGIDPRTEPVPIRPAAHYHMGGVAVDNEGRSSVRGLWACGEVARTGLHGANRLASNSLLEAVVSAVWVARSVADADREAPRHLPAPPLPLRPDPARVRPIVSNALGIIRDGETLRTAVADLLAPALGCGPESDPASVALMIAIAALRREESRGAHFRSDFPENAARSVSASLTLDDALTAAIKLTNAALPLSRSA